MSKLKDKVVAFRLSQEDFAHFEEKLLTSQMTRSAFFGEVFLQANVNLTVQSLPSKELGHLTFLYNKASNNLNQIAHLTQKVSERLYRQVNNGLIDIVKRLNFDYIINMSYSLDFRRKVLAIKKEKGLSIRETAKRFCIGSATVSRWIKQIEPKPAASRSRKIDKSALEKDVRQYPDAYQRERAIRFGVCQKAIWQALKKLSITYKKKHLAILKQMKIYENRFVKK